MSEKHFLGVPLPPDTQSVDDQEPITLEQFTAQIERQKAEYMKNPHRTVTRAFRMQPNHAKTD